MSRRSDLADVARRPYWREVDARVVVDAWRNGGETLSAFAGRLGVDPRRVSRWSLRLEQAEPVSLRFHPVRLVGGDTRQSGTAIEIELGTGRRIRIPPGFAAEDLRRVLAVLDEGARC